MCAKKSFEKTTCVTKIIYHIFMQKCSKICKNLFHNAKRTKVCTSHDLNISTPVSHKIKHSIQKTFSSRYMYPALRKYLPFVLLCGWTPTYNFCAKCLLLVFFPIDFDMDGSNGNQLQKLPIQGKEILDFFPFAANGNDYLATTDEQKLSVYKWMNV